MITIPLSTEDLTKVRLVPSPLWETVASFAVLMHHGRHTVHAPWAARARRVWIIQLEAHFKSRGRFMPEDAFVPIRELARRTGVATSGDVGASLLRAHRPAAPQRAGGRRHYTASSAERVALIRLCQNAGFTLAEIGRLLAARSWDRRGWGHLAERKITELDARIEDAQRAKKLFKHALECPHRDLLTCPRFRSALEAQLERPGSQHR